MFGHWIPAATLFLSLPAETPMPPRLMPNEVQRPAALRIPRGRQTFDAREALNGATATRRRCTEVPDAYWVPIPGGGACIRTYPAANRSGGGTMLVYLPGDVLLRGRGGVRLIAGSYARRSPADIRQEMTGWSRNGGVPAIFIARPGLYGSSGNHGARRRIDEVRLVDGALDRIKARYRVSRFILAGQSGGGHLVAALVNRRRDIAAAFIGSGLVSAVEVMRAYQARRRRDAGPVEDPNAVYDPIGHVGEIAGPGPDIFVLSDPGDRIVPFLSQRHYVERLRSAGRHPTHILLRGEGRSRHLLAEPMKAGAALYARGEDAAAISAALRAMAPLPSPPEEAQH
ncbi:alpha/beta hydrolase family protein [Sphingomonas desiccabilis]|uniref:alpha/beta hydrolase family protein n=1 Tax=Sphingomonas desiccabilis TaxID=429134 RepID=UPI0010120475|nr:alpha/beta hydrolase [Sphingomonas desiccabilis]MBB3912739.1 hypothetical protein [Sphingomonas desiccabilis]